MGIIFGPSVVGAIDSSTFRILWMSVGRSVEFRQAGTPVPLFESESLIFRV